MTREFDEALQKCLDLIRGGQDTVDSALARYPEFAETLRPQLLAALWISSHRQALQPRPGFAAASRRRLVARLREERRLERPTWWERLQKSWTVQRLAPTAFVMLLMFSLFISGTVVSASHQSLPGDDLYTIKRTLEQFALATTFDEAKDAELHISFVRQRLTEVRTLIVEGRYDDVARTVSDYEEQVSQTIEMIDALATQDVYRALELAHELEAILAQQRFVMTGLSRTVPDSVYPAISKVIVVSEKGEAAVEQLSQRVPPTSAPPPIEEPSPTKSTPSPTRTPRPTPTLAPTQKSAPEEPEPTAEPTKTEAPTETSTAIPPTRTPLPTETARPPTDTPTPVPTNTPAPTYTPTPVPTNTPAPTNTPTPLPTDTPTPTPTDTPTPIPTNTPTPVPTNTPTPEPTNTPTPMPSNTPAPTDAPVVTDTVTPSETSGPAEGPLPEVTPTP